MPRYGEKSSLWNKCFSSKSLRCSLVSRSNRAASLGWYRQYQNWPAQDYSTVLLSGEFDFYPDSRRTRLLKRFGNVKRRHVQEGYTYRGSTIMVWGVIIIGGRSEVAFPKSSLSICRLRFTSCMIMLGQWVN